MSTMTREDVVRMSCFRCGIRFEILRNSFEKRMSRNPVIADSCKDCYWIVKFEVWK